MTSLYQASILNRQGRRGGGGGRPNRGDRVPNWEAPGRPGRPGYGGALDNNQSPAPDPYDYNSQAHADLINNTATGTPGTGMKGDPDFDSAQIRNPTAGQGTTLAPMNPVGPNPAMPNMPTFNPSIPAPVAPTPNMSSLTSAGRAATYDPTTYNAANIGVSGNATVSGRLNQLMDEDSYYMQIARQNAMRDVNARGMLNSSMAVSAAQRAAIEAGLPIASQDAATYAQREMNLMNAQNAARQFNAGAFNQAGQFNAGQTNAMSQFNAGQANAMEMFNTGQANTMAQEQWGTLQNQRHQEIMANLTSTLNSGQAERLAHINNSWQRLTNNDLNMTNTFMSALELINRTATNTDLEGPQQQLAIDNIMNQLNSFLPFLQAVQGGTATSLNGGS